MLAKKEKNANVFYTLTGVGLNGCSRQACTLTLAIVMLSHNTLAGAECVIGTVLIIFYIFLGDTPSGLASFRGVNVIVGRHNSKFRVIQRLVRAEESLLQFFRFTLHPSLFTQVYEIHRTHRTVVFVL